MDKKLLQNNILEASYNREVWLDVLKEYFGVKKLFKEPKKIPVDKNRAEYAVELGSFVTADEREVGVFEVKLQPQIWIERNRVGLRNLLRQIYKFDVDGALIVFVQDAKWRFSYVSEIRTEDGKKETEPKRYTYLFGESESCRTAADRFDKLKGKPIYLNDLYDAFSVEKLNKDFFKTYKEFNDRFWKYLASDKKYYDLLSDNTLADKEKKEKPIRDFTKKLLGRIVFLHFLQKKGWLGVPANVTEWKNGDPRFLQNLFRNSDKKDKFHSSVLKSLFFETLNKKREMDLAPAVLGSNIKIPYLNGGLFDKDISFVYDFDFPQDLFAQLFDFFEQYNFTIDENDPFDSEVGIDPEMLGHIFENLLEENRQKGTFYTPKEVVHYMCQESLIQYLRTHLPECTEDDSPATIVLQNLIRKGITGERTDKKNFVVQQAKRIEKLLDNVTVCDPAIGSGAFPMGMLQEIYKAKTALDLTLDHTEVKKQIIQNCIYGVDIENGAVEIARLRFWLALVVDETEPQPLPNLDYKIMQGNSLLESFEGVDLSNLADTNKEDDTILFAEKGQYEIGVDFSKRKQVLLMFDHASKTQLYELIDDYFNYDETNDKRYKNKQFIKDEINKIVEGKLIAKFYLSKPKIEQKIDEIQNALKANRITVGDAPGVKLKKEKNVEKLKRDLSEKQKALDKINDIIEHLHELQTRNDKPYFLWHLWFKEVFDKGGFDIVIGNPPYLQLAKLKDDALAKAGFETFDKNGDLYCLFYEIGIRMLRKNGVLTYITSNSWLQTQYGYALRKYFIENTNPLVLLNFTDQQLFETAIVETNIILLKKSVFQKNLTVAVLDNQFDKREPMAEFVESLGHTVKELSIEGWTIGDEKGSELKTKIELAGRKLIEWNNEIFRGVTTGLNEAFIIPGEVKKKLITDDPNTKKLIRRTLRGRDLRRYSYNFSDQWIICTFPSKNIDINEYPGLKKYFLEFGKDRLEQSGKPGSRKKTGNEWFETQDQIAYWKQFEEPKIVWGELSDQAKFTFDDAGHYLNNTIFMLTGDSLKYLLCVLNSKVAQWYFEKISTTSGMGTNRWLKYKIEQLPIPIPGSKDEKLLEHLVARVLSIKTENGDSSKWENKIDAKIFHLYGLNESEMVQVLETFQDLSIKDRNQIQNEYWNISNNKFKTEA
jgi:adenine-specific DNA-methyltransferase